MKINFFTTFVACLVTGAVFSQSSINNYKYIIVPKKFDFQKEKDQYQLNGLTQFLFNKYGFEAVIEGSEYPKDLALNRCLALNSNLIKDPGMFNTKIKVELSDCGDKVVYTSAEGASRQKDYKTAYNYAIRDAFKSIEALRYKYEPVSSITSKSNTIQTVADGKRNIEIQKLKQEIESLKQEKQEKQAEVNAVKSSNLKASKSVENSVVDSVIKKDSPVLYAQVITHGFQLVDSTPKVVYTIKSTSLKDVYLVEGKTAVIYKNASNWLIEFYTNGVLKQEVLNIKF